MQKKLSRSVTATAFVVPAIFAGALIGPSPANAATTKSGTHGICNGVVNQLAHRGTVQENLLKVAAKKNADLIASLTAQRTALQTQRTDLQGQITQINQQIADLDAQGARLDADLQTVQDDLDSITAQRAIVAGQVSDAEKALAGLKTQQSGVASQLGTLQEQLALA